MFRYSLFGTIPLFIIVVILLFGFSLQSRNLKSPTLQIVILVHPFNKIKILPFSLGGIEDQKYPKDRINVYIVTSKLHLSSESEQTINNRLTLELLRKWAQTNNALYHDIQLHVESEESEVQQSYWNPSRFRKIIRLKNDGLQLAKKNWADYALFIDADVVLTNQDAFWKLILHNTDHTVFAPMLYSLGTYSNFWAGMTSQGYYKRTEDYLPILEREKTGTFLVPMVHSCIFIHLSNTQSDLLTFDPNDVQEESPLDDVIAFAKIAKQHHVELFVDNQEVWGFLPPPIEDHTDVGALEQDFVDLELESLIEGRGFSESSYLYQFVQRPPKSSLGVDKVFVINLYRRTERRKRMLKCLEVLGIEAEIWNATDGKSLDKDFLDKNGLKVMPNYLDPYHKRPMTFGEIGCFLSHYNIWLETVKNNFSDVIIFEDDVRFERNFVSKWLASLQNLNANDFDFVYFGRKKQTNDEEISLLKTFVMPKYSYWTIGYYITQKGAQKLIDANPLQNLLPVDEFLPIMYDQHDNKEWTQYFSLRNLKALSVNPLLIYPTHYVGDELYVSDTENSDKLGKSNRDVKNCHPKHTDL